MPIYKKNFLLLLLPIAIFLQGCQSLGPSDHQNPLEMNIDESNEGYYPIHPKEGIPVALMEKFGVSRELIDSISESAGTLLYEYPVKINAVNYEKQIVSYCSNPAAKSINPKLCDFMIQNEAICKREGCEFKGVLPACSGVRYRNFFITARHCLPSDQLPRDPFAKFIRKDGSIRTVKLRRTILLQHRAPHDLAIFRMFGTRFADENIRIRTSKLKFREPVFGIGWPMLQVRKGLQQKFDYDLTYKHNRITFGRIMQPNEMGRSFCHFTNMDNVSNIEAWELENDCPKGSHWRKEKGFKKRYFAREEKDPFLANSDMTWGMSGSPLFDASGNLIGIGSNVLSSDPRAYDQNKYAVYVKAENLLKLLISIEPRFNRITKQPLSD